MAAVICIKTKLPTPYRLESIHAVTHDAKTFRFGLPADGRLDMLPVIISPSMPTVDGKTEKRPYTPLVADRYDRLFRVDRQTV